MNKWFTANVDENLSSIQLHNIVNRNEVFLSLQVNQKKYYQNWIQS